MCDGALRQTYTSGKLGAVHTIGCPACDTYVTQAAAEHRAHITSGLERDKRSKHAAAATANNMRYLTWAGTTYGGWGDE